MYQAFIYVEFLPTSMKIKERTIYPQNNKDVQALV